MTFSAVVAGTPGPSNALLTAVGASVGVRRGLASLLGQVTGMGAMLFAITLGLGNVLLSHPLALDVLKWGGVAMFCWMAWKIATAAHAEAAANAPAGFLGMAAFHGVGAGSLIRHQVGAIIAVVAWPLVIELVVGATLPTVGRFLPYTAAAMMAGDTNGGGMPQIPHGVAALPYPAAIAVLAVVAGAVAVTAASTTVHRDVI